jgi:hypothetical protein
MVLFNLRQVRHKIHILQLNPLGLLEDLPTNE